MYIDYDLFVLAKRSTIHQSMYSTNAQLQSSIHPTIHQTSSLHQAFIIHSVYMYCIYPSPSPLLSSILLAVPFLFFPLLLLCTTTITTTIIHTNNTIIITAGTMACCNLNEIVIHYNEDRVNANAEPSPTLPTSPTNVTSL